MRRPEGRADHLPELTRYFRFVTYFGLPSSLLALLAPFLSALFGPRPLRLSIEHMTPPSDEDRYVSPELSLLRSLMGPGKDTWIQPQTVEVRRRNDKALVAYSTVPSHQLLPDAGPAGRHPLDLPSSRAITVVRPDGSRELFS